MAAALSMLYIVYFGVPEESRPNFQIVMVLKIIVKDRWIKNITNFDPNFGEEEGGWGSTKS